MRPLFALALAAACVVGSAPGFARNPGHARHSPNPTTLLGPAAPTPAFESRIPAPLPPPAQAPVINGPLSQPAFRGLTGIAQ